MPHLIKRGAIVEDNWQGRLLSLEKLNQLDALEGSIGVVLEPDQPPSAIGQDLAGIELVAINFPLFMDGRGFSYARELRELGFEGEIRATGQFIRDQLYYLSRCGFDAFQFEDDSQLDEALASLGDFSDAYQADVHQPEPLFRRR